MLDATGLAIIAVLIVLIIFVYSRVRTTIGKLTGAAVGDNAEDDALTMRLYGNPKVGSQSFGPNRSGFADENTANVSDVKVATDTDKVTDKVNDKNAANKEVTIASDEGQFADYQGAFDVDDVAEGDTAVIDGAAVEDLPFSYEHADARAADNDGVVDGARPYWRARKAPGAPANVCGFRNPDGSIDPNNLDWQDGMDVSERMAVHARFRGDGTRAVAGSLDRMRMLDPYIRHELEDEDRAPWWGRHE